MSTVSVPTPLDYLAAGLKLIALPHGSKAPRDDGWQLEQNCIHTIEAWQGPRPSGDEGQGETTRIAAGHGTDHRSTARGRR
jgi:hypothetical protein